jgi:hypothetical protein
MRRLLVTSMTSAVLALALLPGSVAAVMPGGLDRNVPPAATPTYYTATDTVTQTFTAGVLGALTHVELYCRASGDPVAVTIFVNLLREATADCTSAAGWVDFTFTQSQLMAVGSSGTLMISPAAEVDLGVAGSSYSGGAAGDDVGAPIAVDDFAFRTYVLPLQTTSNTWNPATVAPGVSTPVTLTTVVAFPPIPLDGPLQTPVGYQVQLMHLPSWFTPTGALTCTGVTVPTCDLTTLQAPSGIQWLGDGGGPALTLVIPGTAAPAAEDFTEAAGVYSCIFSNSDGVDAVPPTGRHNVNVGECDQVETDLVVGQTATPPPSVTAGSSGSSGEGLPLWLLPAALAAAIASLLVIRRRIWLAR